MWRTGWILMLAWALAGPLRAVDVEAFLWGFDGSSISMQPTLVSVRVRNNTPDPFPGPLMLDTGGGLLAGGIQYQQPCYLAPYTERWVQFTVRADYLQNCTLRWQDPDTTWKQYTPAQGPRTTQKPVIVALRKDADQRPLAFPRFPESLFPTRYPATLGLDGVLLDHVPDWPDVKRTAFFDWLRQGGILVLLEERDGRFPDFPDDYAVLREAVDRNGLTVGRGRIVVQPLTLSTLRENDLPTMLRLPTETEKESSRHYYLQASDTLLGWLRLRMRPEHPWGLINFLGFVYLLLVGPLAMFLFRKRIRKVGGVMLYLGGCILLFSLLFLHLGRRGYGEQAGALDWVYARVLDDHGRVYLRGWSQVFVTDSGDYDLSFGDGSHQFTVRNQGEGMQATLREGSGGQIRVRLPVFSSAGVERESVQDGPSFRVEKIGDEQYRLITDVNVDKQAWALVNGNIVPLVIGNQGKVRISGTPGEEIVKVWFENHRYYRLNRPYRRRDTDLNDGDLRQLAMQLALAAGMGMPHAEGRTPSPWATLPALTGTHLFFSSPLPPEWRTRYPGLTRSEGTALWHLDLTALEIPK